MPTSFPWHSGQARQINEEQGVVIKISVNKCSPIISSEYGMMFS